MDKTRKLTCSGIIGLIVLLGVIRTCGAVEVTLLSMNTEWFFY